MKAFQLTAIVLFASTVVWATGCGNHEPADGPRDDEPQAVSPDETATADAEQMALHKPDPRGTYGAGIVLDESTALQAIMAEPETYENKVVQVQATIDDVCARRGCWIDLADAAGTSVRVKVTDGEIVFPLSAKGHETTVEGIVERIELTEEQHRAWKEHEAEERGVPFDSTSVSGPTTMWRLQGLGARIDD